MNETLSAELEQRKAFRAQLLREIEQREQQLAATEFLIGAIEKQLAGPEVAPAPAAAEQK